MICIGILLFMFGLIVEARGKDWERSEENLERRHQELLDCYSSYSEPKIEKRTKTITRRRIIQDENGRFIGEETIIEGELDD